MNQHLMESSTEVIGGVPQNVFKLQMAYVFGGSGRNKRWDTASHGRIGVDLSQQSTMLFQRDPHKLASHPKACILK